MVKKRAKKKAASKKVSRRSSSSDNGKIASILAYLLIGVIWYFLDKSLQKDSSVRFHVGQGIVLIIFSFIWHILISILYNISMLSIVHLLTYVPWVFAILGIINVVNGNDNELPLIGQYSERIGL